MELYKSEWDASYNKKDNFLFYPHEEIIRFTSKYIKKRIDYDTFTTIYKKNDKPKVIDIGCGIGRHLKFLHEYNIDFYGIDISSIAIEKSRKLLSECRIENIENKIIECSISNTPFDDDFFDFAISHGVIDSMDLQTANVSLNEIHRFLKINGLFYIDLICGDCSEHYPEFCGEKIVKSSHETGTIQSYYNWTKILKLIEKKWSILEAYLIKNKSLTSSSFHSRYHLVLEKK